MDVCPGYSLLSISFGLVILLHNSVMFVQHYPFENGI